MFDLLEAKADILEPVIPYLYLGAQITGQQLKTQLSQLLLTLNSKHFLS
jgi:hypothetical protein